MAQPQELEAASRSSETYLAENGGGRPASVQPRSCIRVQEGTGQNYTWRALTGTAPFLSNPYSIVALPYILRYSFPR